MAIADGSEPPRSEHVLPEESLGSLPKLSAGMFDHPDVNDYVKEVNKRWIRGKKAE